MSRKILLFGPPGSGKSTLVGEIASYGEITALDLEALPEHERDNVLSYLHGNVSMVIGMADRDIHRKYFQDEYKVLLLPPFEYYMNQMRIRNLKNPKKRGQNEANVWRAFNAMKNVAHHIVDDKNIWQFGQPGMVATSVISKAFGPKGV